MAISVSSLVNRWKTALGTPSTSEGVTIQDDILEKLAQGVVDEIQANAATSNSGNVVIPSGSSAGTYPFTSTGTVS